MLVATLLLAAHCADRSFCPTKRELRQAVERRLLDDLWDINVAANRDDPDNITLITARRVTRVSGIYCGAPYPGEPSTLTCTVTLHYGRDRAFQIVRLTRNGSDWSVLDKLEVFRRARP
jgi:hypothetical protein